MRTRETCPFDICSKVIVLARSVYLLTWFSIMLEKLPLEKLGPEDGEESRPICREELEGSRGWRKIEEGTVLDSVSLFLFEPL